jgi:hypothetical protein
MRPEWIGGGRGVFYREPVTHRITNTGKTPIHNLVVELKDVAN